MDEQRMTGETGDKNAVIDQKLRQFFDGKIVRKDLTKISICTAGFGTLQVSAGCRASQGRSLRHS